MKPLNLSERNPNPPLSLTPGLVHLWSLSVKDLGPFALPEIYGTILNGQELQKFRGFAVDDAKLEFLAARLSIRTLLTMYFPQVERSSWQFEANQYGKPRVSNPQTGAPIEFNISHSGGEIICALTQAAALGIDIEKRKQQTYGKRPQ